MILDKESYFLSQKDKILKQLKFAKESVPYFQKELQNINLEEIKTYEDFCKQIPIIKHNEVIENPNLFCSNLPIEFVRHSSSTTGKPKKVFLTKDDLKLWEEEGRISITPYFKEGMTAAYSQRKEAYYLSSLKEAIEFSGGKVTTFDPRNMEEIIDCIKNTDIILDYAEMIYYLSDKLSSLDINLGKNLIIVYTGNKFEDQDVKQIKKNFKKIGVKVEIYSEYATTEIGPIGCSDNLDPNRFKIIYDNIAFIEVVNPKTNKPSDTGEIIVTTLNRTGSVFVRYKVGDIGKIAFDEDHAFFHLNKRKTGIKVVSVFFSPDQIFRIIRRELNTPLFCEINLEQDKYLSKINIKIYCEEQINKDTQNHIKEKLAKELEIIDDLGSTVRLKLNFSKKELNEDQLKKGFKFIHEL